MRCIPKEREALLQFKAAIVDRYGMLSSWTTPDCCRWEGIRCSNLTGHVLRLHLPGQFNADISRDYMSGEIHTSLMELQQLEYLNLSSNYFRFKGIPEFLGSLINLKYLDLSSSQFGGKIPSELGSLFHLKYLNLAWNYYLEGSIPRELGNLSRLQYLDLRGHSYLVGYIPSQLGNLSNLHKLYLGGYDGALNIVTTDHWLSNLISLTHLSFQSISNFDRSPSWFQMAAKLPKLRELSLVGCGLSDHSVLSFNPSNFNFSASLTVLDLSQNSFTQSMIFQWVSNTTSSLVELYLSSNLLEGSTSNGFGLFMNSLERLDLSYNVFKGQDLKSFMNICTLCYLDMSGNNMTEDFLSIIHHLSSGCARYSLQELNFKFNHITRSLVDLSIFSSLKRLDLFENQLSGKTSEEIKLPSQLEQLSIGSNSLEGGVPKSFGNTCTLELLDLSRNKLSEDPTIIFDHLSGCSRFSLREIYLSQNKLNGTLPDFSMFSKLEMLDLSGNHLKDGILKSPHHNGTVLRSLRLSNNLLNGNLPTIIYHLSQYSRYSLQLLDLSMNQISGTLPNILSMFSSLKRLYLESNKLNGTISEDLLFSAELEVLNLRSNSLKGVITDSHFSNMSKLVALLLSDNLLTVDFSQIFNPSFQLDVIDLRSCKLGPLFPKWLETQNMLNGIDISNSGISDIVPEWFWTKLALQEWITVNISFNNLQGVIPNLPLGNPYEFISLASNQFEGQVPSFLRGSMFLDLSNNKFTDSRLFLCSSGVVETSYQLDLSNNKFFGKIPYCCTHFKSLIYLNMSQNKFSGNIPTSMGSLLELQVLLLRNNSLTGDISSSLGNCTKLVMLDMAENRLSGSIPHWIGSKLLKLQILSLGNNHFNGSLPLQICYLRSIRILDLSQNNLFGQIPKCIKNFSSMTQKASLRDHKVHQYSVNTTYVQGNTSYNLNALLTWKGSKQMFTNNGLSLLKSIDLSNNQFSGEIPKEIGDLFDLISLNLSRNNLMGKIPSDIGKLKSLEFIDLSRNELIGSIPSGLAQIDRLTMLDLPHNYLSGKIPIDTQLQSFDASKYEGNVDLCGPPLEKLCPDGVLNQKPHEDNNLVFNHEFYVSMAIGFVINFGGVFGSILVIRSLRHVYFKFLSNIADTLYIMTTVKIFKWWRRT
ncbi:receptor-like protein EIX2 isoform X2 [Vigna unguiculata]|nr:receptor-like protein EIX2 isoform X2 [Vigna unguiculata]